MIWKQSRMVVAMSWDRGRGDGEMLVSEYKLISSGDLMYSIVIIVDNIVLYTLLKLLRQQILNVLTIKEKIIMLGNGDVN